MNFADTEKFPPFEIYKAFAGSIVYPPGGQLGPRIQNDYQLVLLKPGHAEKFVFAGKEETWHRWITVSVADPLQSSAIMTELPMFLPISAEMNQIVDHMLSLRFKTDPYIIECFGFNLPSALYVGSQ
jgi:hypothetical protein